MSPYLVMKCHHHSWAVLKGHCMSFVCVHYLLTSVQLFAHPQTIARQASLSMEFSSKSTGVDCHSLPHRNFPTEGWNPGLLPRRQTLHRLCHRGVLLSFASQEKAPPPLDRVLGWRAAWQHLAIWLWPGVPGWKPSDLGLSRGVCQLRVSIFLLSAAVALAWANCMDGSELFHIQKKALRA